jgi:hypothetical protein
MVLVDYYFYKCHTSLPGIYIKRSCGNVVVRASPVVPYLIPHPHKTIILGEMRLFCWGRGCRQSCGDRRDAGGAVPGRGGGLGLARQWPVRWLGPGGEREEEDA